MVKRMYVASNARSEQQYSWLKISCKQREMGRKTLLASHTAPLWTGLDPTICSIRQPDVHSSVLVVNWDRMKPSLMGNGENVICGVQNWRYMASQSGAQHHHYTTADTTSGQLRPFFGAPLLMPHSSPLWDQQLLLLCLGFLKNVFSYLLSDINGPKSSPILWDVGCYCKSGRELSGAGLGLWHYSGTGAGWHASGCGRSVVHHVKNQCSSEPNGLQQGTLHGHPVHCMGWSHEAWPMLLCIPFLNHQSRVGPVI